MLTTQALQRLVEIYHNKVATYPPRQMPTGAVTVSHQVAAKHIHWMCEQLEEQIAKQLASWTLERDQKINRWIGWIQSAMFFGGFFTVDETREHVRQVQLPACPSCSGTGMRSTGGGCMGYDDEPCSSCK